MRPSTWSLVRIDQTFLGLSGGLAPVNLPLFQGMRFGALRLGLSFCMVHLLGYGEDQHAARRGSAVVPLAQRQVANKIERRNS